MPPGAMHALSPWKRRPLTIPPNSFQAWIHLATWEIWMGMLVCVIFAFGLSFLVTSPNKIIVFSDLSNCYAPPPVSIPCERILYRGGILNASFTALVGVMLIGVAGWLLWELWNAAEPKPITDDFLKLLNDSFGRDWRNPLTWAWSRVFWAYGFTAVGVTLTATIGLMLWTLVAPSRATSAAPGRVETSQHFRVGQ
jgi:hypothetical protein